MGSSKACRKFLPIIKMKKFKALALSGGTNLDGYPLWGKEEKRREEEEEEENPKSLIHPLFQISITVQRAPVQSGSPPKAAMEPSFHVFGFRRNPHHTVPTNQQIKMTRSTLTDFVCEIRKGCR